MVQGYGDALLSPRLAPPGKVPQWSQSGCQCHQTGLASALLRCITSQLASEPYFEQRRWTEVCTCHGCIGVARQQTHDYTVSAGTSMHCARVAIDQTPGVQCSVSWMYLWLGGRESGRPYMVGRLARTRESAGFQGGNRCSYVADGKTLPLVFHLLIRRATGGSVGKRGRVSE